MLAPVPFSTVVFRYLPESLKSGRADSNSEINTLNEKLLDAVNATGHAFLSHTKLRGKYGVRLTIGNIKTTWEDVRSTWELIQTTAAEMSRGTSSLNENSPLRQTN